MDTAMVPGYPVRFAVASVTLCWVQADEPSAGVLEPQPLVLTLSQASIWKPRFVPTCWARARMLTVTAPELSKSGGLTKTGGRITWAWPEAQVTMVTLLAVESVLTFGLEFAPALIRPPTLVPTSAPVAAMLM